MGSQPPLRMLAVSFDYYPPFRVDVAVLFGEELAGRGHRIDWVLQSEAACEQAYVTEWGGGRVWVGPTDLGASLFHRLRKHVRSVLHDLKIFGLVRRGDYEIVQVKDKFIAGIFGLLAARLHGKRFVYWLSYPFPEASLYAAKAGIARYPLLYRIRGHAFRFILYRLLLPRADHVFVQSEQMLRDVAKEGIDASRMTPVPMGIRVTGSDDPPPPVARRLLPGGVPCIVYIGTLIKDRYLDFMVRVLERVRRREPRAVLYFVGRGEDPSDEGMLRAEARRLGLESAVFFTGHLPQSEALQYVLEADVCVSPIYPSFILNAGSPTKLVEYMAMGKAVVANDHPEQRLLIEESGGGRCVPWDEDAFGNAVADLLADPQMAREMGLRGRRYIRARRGYRAIADTVEARLLRVRAAVPG